MDPIRHFFDVVATRSADLPGAIIDHSLRDPSLWTKKNTTIFVENLVTGLVGMGLDVYTPDVTAPTNSAGSFAGSVSTGGNFTANATFSDAGTVPTVVCAAIMYVTKNGVAQAKTAQATTSAFGTISIAYTQAGAIVGDVFQVTMDVSDASGNWLVGFNLGTYTCK